MLSTVTPGVDARAGDSGLITMSEHAAWQTKKIFTTENTVRHGDTLSCGPGNRSDREGVRGGRRPLKITPWASVVLNGLRGKILVFLQRSQAYPCRAVGGAIP